MVVVDLLIVVEVLEMLLRVWEKVDELLGGNMILDMDIVLWDIFDGNWIL